MQVDLDSYPQLKIGDIAPEFTAVNQDGQKFNLHDTLQEFNKVLLIFYPGDDTPGCTKQLCGVRDVYQLYSKLGVKVVGVNHGSSQSHKKFITKYNFPFDIIVDEGKTIRDSYGAVKLFFKNLTVKRGVFLINSDSKIEYMFWGQQDNSVIIEMIKNKK